MDDTDAPSPKEPLLDLQEIQQIVEMMSQNDLSYINLQHGSFKIELRRGSDVEAAKSLLAAIPMAPALAPAPASVPVAAAPAPAAAPAAAAPQPAEEHSGPTINSPMVGTFYRSSSPGEKPFISVGDAVEEGTTVCIIEAMKVMNEIKAEARGTVARVMAEDGKPVQYGQPLFELR
jgi:acetyl-CoA carboxylase biotin carboxyl carrier protein